MDLIETLLIQKAHIKDSEAGGVVNGVKLTVCNWLLAGRFPVLGCVKPANSAPRGGKSRLGDWLPQNPIETRQ